MGGDRDQHIAKVLGDSGIDASEITGIRLAGGMHGMVLLDAEGAVLRPCINLGDWSCVAGL